MKKRLGIAALAGAVVMCIGFVNMAVANSTPGHRQEIMKNKNIISVPDHFPENQRQRLYNFFCDTSRAAPMPKNDQIVVAYQWINKKCMIVIRQGDVQLISPAY